MLVCLVLFAKIKPLHATALSAIPCLLVLLRDSFNGSLHRLGFINAFCPFMVLYGVSANLLAFSKLSKHANRIQTYFYAPFMLMGVFGWLFPESTADDVGIAFSKPADKTLWTFLARSFLSMGALFYTLFCFGRVGMIVGIRNSTLVTAVTTLLDTYLIRRSTILSDAKFSTAKANRFILQTFTLAVLLFVLPSPELTVISSSL